MLKIWPWDARAHSGASLAELQEAITGEVVRTVHYLALCGSDWPEGRQEARAHEVDLAVELGMESGSMLILAWAMDGVNEGVAIEFRSRGESGAESLGGPIDVSGHGDWRQFLGVSIVSLAAAWHVPNEGCPEMPWAYRLGFSDKSSLVIALGESDGAGFTYLPDALVVIFDEGIAATYKIPASSTSSSGQKTD